MPVTLKLFDLVTLPNSRPLWPKEFESLVAKLEEKVAERAQWGVIADWLDENDEPELAEAFRWIGKKADVVKGQRFVEPQKARRVDTIEFRSKLGGIAIWPEPDAVSNPASFAAVVYGALSDAREKAKKALEELA